MPRVIFVLSFLGILLFASAMFLNHAREYHDPDLRALLVAPPGCPAPCFLGIRVGETTVKAGLEQLQDNPLIRSVSLAPLYPNFSSSPLSSNQYHVEFTPPFMSTRKSWIQLNVYERSGIIEGIYLLNGDIHLSDILLVFGEPERLVLDDRSRLGMVSYIGFYPDYQLYMWLLVPICTRETSFAWGLQQNVVIGIETSWKYGKSNSRYPNNLDRPAQGWATNLGDLRQVNCV